MRNIDYTLNTDSNVDLQHSGVHLDAVGVVCNHTEQFVHRRKRVPRLVWRLARVYHVNDHFGANPSLQHRVEILGVRVQHDVRVLAGTDLLGVYRVRSHSTQLLRDGPFGAQDVALLWIW